MTRIDPEDGILRVEVTAAAADNTIARIVRLVEEAQESKVPTQRLVDRFSRIYTPAVVAVAALSLVKTGVHWSGMEILTLNTLFTIATASAVFIIGFLLSSVLSDYKESDRLPADISRSAPRLQPFACRNRAPMPRCAKSARSVRA